MHKLKTNENKVFEKNSCIHCKKNTLSNSSIFATQKRKTHSKQ